MCNPDLMSAEIRVFLVDDHPMIRQGCRRLLEKSNINVTGEADSGKNALQYVADCDPDIVIMDISMEELGGLESMRRLNSRMPHISFILFTMHDNPMFAMRAIKLGAKGYVTKSASPAVLVEAVKKVAQGEVYLSHDIAQSLAISNLSLEDDPTLVLSNREFDIFTMISDGMTVTQIAKVLSLSQKSVSNNIFQIKQKLGIKTNADFTKLAVSFDIVKKNVMGGGDAPS